MFDPFDLSHLTIGVPSGLDALGYDVNNPSQLASVSGTQSVQELVSGSTDIVTGSPASTLVGHSGSLEIDLLWDQSVTSDPNWHAIESAVVTGAELFTNVFTNPIEINIRVGYGEIDNIPIDPNNVAEAIPLGVFLPADPSYPYHSLIEGELAANDASLVHAGLMSADAVMASRPEPYIFLPRAEGRALGAIPPVSPYLDGYIGLSNFANDLSFGGNVSPLQYSAVAAAAHEISHVLGRVTGSTYSLAPDFYTPLDLFRYSGPGDLAVAGTAGHFSLNGGATALNTFSEYGDRSDWEANLSNALDAFSAFGTPGIKVQVTPVDYLELAALGYQLPAAKIPQVLRASPKDPNAYS